MKVPRIDFLSPIRGTIKIIQSTNETLANTSILYSAALHVVALSLTHSDHSILQPAATHRACGLLVAILALDEVGIGELLRQLVVDAVVRPAAGRLHDVILGSTGTFKTRTEVEEDLFVQVVAEAIHHRAPSSSLELG